MYGILPQLGFLCIQNAKKKWDGQVDKKGL
jgi:hypothetical protein